MDHVPAGPLDRHRFRPTVRALMLLPVLVAASSWLYMKSVERSVGPAPIGIKIGIPLDFLVLDDATGEPIQGAEVDLPFLHPDWRNRPELLQDRDLRRDLSPREEIRPPLVTGGNGRTKISVIAGRERLLKRQVHGFLPVAGSPEVVFHPVHGVRVSADGHVTRVRYLEEVRKEDGRPLAHGTPLPIVVRLKRASLNPTSSR